MSLANVDICFGSGGLNSEGVEEINNFFSKTQYCFPIAKSKAKSFDLGSLKETVSPE